MDDKNEFELVVTQGNVPWWRIIVAAIFFTGSLYILYSDALLFYYAGFTEQTGLLAAKSVKGIALCFAGGISFSMTKSVLIDLDKDKLVSRFQVGPFSRDQLTAVPTLEYVSVFCDSKEYYQVNLWYKGNKHYKMYRFDDKMPAMKFGRYVAKKLQIDLLDATVKGNPIWINDVEA